MTKACTCLCASWHSQHCCLVQQACQTFSALAMTMTSHDPPRLWGDVSLRAVSAMAAAVVFDAVARQSTENVPSVLAQASRVLHVKSWAVEHWHLTWYYFLATTTHSAKSWDITMTGATLLIDKIWKALAGFRPKAWAWPRKLCKRNFWTGIRIWKDLCFCSGGNWWVHMSPLYSFVR